jgi:hypothetical protein
MKNIIRRVATIRRRPKVRVLLVLLVQALPNQRSSQARATPLASSTAIVMVVKNSRVRLIRGSSSL